MKQIIDWLMTCGYTENEASREAERMIHYHMTGIDAVSRECAIQMILDDLND